ncbi:fibronectin type III domain-containing protein [Paenibacillus aurantiacus]|uniref:Fibronectin type III domain-containing protein n=1 Tax=Paenibacillus aurantiacus TaxID=1936118 RepID=A0ABV5L0H3_9BACL
MTGQSKLLAVVLALLLLVTLPQTGVAAEESAGAVSMIDMNLSGDVEQLDNHLAVGTLFHIEGYIWWSGNIPPEFARVEAEVAGKVAVLMDKGIGDSRFCRVECTLFVGDIDLSGVPKGKQNLIVRAIETNGKVTEHAFPVLYHEAPTLQIEEPLAYSAALPNLQAKASCTDDLGYVCRVMVEETDFTGSYSLLTRMRIPYKPLVDEPITLNTLGIQYLKFTALDSIGRKTIRYVPVYPEVPDSHYRVLAAYRGGVVLDAQPAQEQVINYNTISNQLELYQQGAVTVIPPVMSDLPRAFLMPGGAIFEYSPAGESDHRLVEWRDGQLEDLGPVQAQSLKAKGNYAVFIQSGNDALGEQLVLRDLAAGTNRTIASARDVLPAQLDLAENGTVVYSLRQPGSRNIMLYRDGSLKQITHDTKAYNTYPVTDGESVLLIRNTYDSVSGALIVVRLDGGQTELNSFADQYMIRSGWIAYRTMTGVNEYSLRIVSPSGQQMTLTAPSSQQELEGLGDNGDVAFSSGYPGWPVHDLYISTMGASGRKETKMATTNTTPFQAQGAWYGRIGNTLVELPVPKDGLAPTWPTGSGVTREGAEWSWPAAQDNVGIASYRIYVAGQPVLELPGDMLHTTVNEADWTRYGSGDVQLAAVDAAGNERRLRVMEYSPEEPGIPRKPDSLRAEADATSVRLSWSKPEGDDSIQSFGLYRDDFFVAIVPESENSYMFSDLPEETDFDFRVISIDKNFGISWPAETTARTTSDYSVPEWPAGSTISASKIGPQSVDLTWTAASDDKGVIAYRIVQDGVVVRQTEDDALGATIDDLAPQTLYTFKIEAGDASGHWSTNGPTIAVQTGADDMLAPTWPAGSAVVSGGTTTRIALIHWTPAKDDVGVTGYRIMSGTNLLAEVDGNTRKKGIEGLTPDTTYVLKVEAKDAAGNWSTDGPSVTVRTLK